MDEDPTPRATRHLTRLSRRQEIEAHPDFGNIKPMKFFEKSEGPNTSRTLPLHSTPHRTLLSPSFEIPRNEESGGSTRRNRNTDNERIRELEDAVSNLRELLRTQARIDTARNWQRDTDNVQRNNSSHYLPRIDIPTFNGRREDFPRFWEAFNRIIDSQQWSDIEKFSYLITKLEGSASTAIKMIPITEAGYPVAKAKLEATYL
ncbi:unnamed protein product, partial [Auanema sp. JU1783]